MHLGPVVVTAIALFAVMPILLIVVLLCDVAVVMVVVNIVLIVHFRLIINKIKYLK